MPRFAPGRSGAGAGPGLTALRLSARIEYRFCIRPLEEPVPTPAGVRAPRQVRSQASLERVLEAAQGLAAEQGFAAATMAEIARRSRTSIGALYARFRDKDALLDCLHERFCARALAQVEAGLDPGRWRGRPLRDVVSAAVASLVHVDAHQAGLIRAFVVRGATDEGFRLRAAKVGDTIVRRLSELVLERRHETACADPEAAVEMGVWLVLAHVDQRALFGPVPTATRVRKESDRIAALTDVVLALLGARDPKPPGLRASSRAKARPKESRHA